MAWLSGFCGGSALHFALLDMAFPACACLIFGLLLAHLSAILGVKQEKEIMREIEGASHGKE
jgi:hypothetical protein